MNLVARFILRIFHWLRSFVPEKGTRSFRVIRVADRPSLLAANTLYLVGDDSLCWFAALRCPCGCGDEIVVSLLTTDRPHWKLQLSIDGSPTLSPSVWRRKGCRSHFFLREGLIQWCG